MALPTLSSGNWLIDSLSTCQRDTLLAQSEQVELAAGQVLVRARHPVSHFYFPTEGSLSLVAEGTDFELGLIGREGIGGVDALLGKDTSAGSETVVRVKGAAWRISVDRMLAIASQDHEVKFTMLRYVHHLMSEMAAAATAAASLPVLPRLARWILLHSDRAGVETLAVTHDHISSALGTRRASVTLSMHILEGTGAVRAWRGAIRILDRERLNLSTASLC